MEREAQATGGTHDIGRTVRRACAPTTYESGAHSGPVGDRLTGRPLAHRPHRGRQAPPGPGPRGGLRRAARRGRVAGGNVWQGGLVYHPPCASGLVQEASRNGREGGGASRLANAVGAWSVADAGLRPGAAGSGRARCRSGGSGRPGQIESPRTLLRARRARIAGGVGRVCAARDRGQRMGNAEAVRPSPQCATHGERGDSGAAWASGTPCASYNLALAHHAATRP